MYRTVLEGYPTLGISEKIELPSVAEIMHMPFLYDAFIDDAYRIGGEHLRKLIDSCPLKNTKKNYMVRSQFQYIKPGYCPIGTQYWHVDGCNAPVMESDDYLHILVGDSSNLYTEFLEEPVVVEEEFEVSKIGHREIMDYFEDNKSKYAFKAKSIEPNRFITMTCRHPHRIGTPTKPEFRYFFEIRESNYEPSRPRRGNEALLLEQFVYRGHYAKRFACVSRNEFGTLIKDY